MRIGIPKEIKTLEFRVALLPDACASLVKAGHDVLLESGAGRGIGYADEAYTAVGVRIATDAAELWGEADLIVKVKEPQKAELALIESRHTLFGYLHLAAEPDLARALRSSGALCIAYETVTDTAGGLPLLAPMSDIAGRLAVQVGAAWLMRPMGGRGVLLGGVTGTDRGHVAVLGAGAAGQHAARTAAELGARVTVLDVRRAPMERLCARYPNITGVYSSHGALEALLPSVDLLVGAVLVPGARAPRLVDRDMVASMPEASMVVDISVDQGGCIGTTRPTTWEDPVYTEEGVQHFAVTNMPGAVARTASQALSGAVLPHLLRLARSDWRDDPGLAAGVNVEDGRLVHEAVRNALEADG
ncbi:MAG: alanine dehydrogenase [Gammaproteobacteria bacterium]